MYGCTYHNLHMLSEEASLEPTLYPNFGSNNLDFFAFTEATHVENISYLDIRQNIECITNLHIVCSLFLPLNIGRNMYVRIKEPHLWARKIAVGGEVAWCWGLNCILCNLDSHQV